MIRYTLKLAPTQLELLKRDFRPPYFSVSAAISSNPYGWDSWSKRRQMAFQKRMKDRYDEDFVPRTMRPTPQLARLYGIIGMVSRRSYRTGHTWYPEFFVPKENQTALTAAYENGGKFEKELAEEDLDVLNYVRERNTYLRRKFINGIPPRFTPREVAREVDITINKATESLNRLTGVLGIRRETFLKTEKVKLIFKEYDFERTSPGWFIPNAREELIDSLLMEESVIRKPYEVSFG